MEGTDFLVPLVGILGNNQELNEISNDLGKTTMRTSLDELNKYSLLKIILLILLSIYTILKTPSSAEHGIPLFVYPIILIGAFLFSLIYFKAVSLGTTLTPGKFRTFSAHVFYDPLPFFHFVAMVGLIQGICKILSGVVLDNAITSYAYISFSVGVGLYASVLIANNKFL